MYYLGSNCESIKKEIRSLLNNSNYKKEDIYKALEELSVEFFIDDYAFEHESSLSEMPTISENVRFLYADDEIVGTIHEKYWK